MFETRLPAHPIYCHQEFLEKLELHRNTGIGKRASLLLQNLSIAPRRQYYKSTSGENKGWRRSRLGGNHGSHYYAWWAPASAEPLQKGQGFESAPQGALILRDIRHHDDHSQATPQNLEQHYLPVTVPEIRGQDYGPDPWTPGQSRFASARTKVKLLKGHPGSGKTTALLHAADVAGAERTLYLTYSRDLANLARDYFDRFCSKDRQFRVLTFDAFLREIAPPPADQSEIIPLTVLRRKFETQIGNYARSLGPWTGQVDALYDELYAHLVGSAAPEGISRFQACRTPRQSEANYRSRRSRYIGEAAVQSALDIAARLERADPEHSLAERFFPELWRAWKAAQVLLDTGRLFNPPFTRTGCIAIDECQDLTALEAYVVGLLANRIRPQVLIAGDEAQTVRPTDFEWGWFNDILHTLAGSPQEHKLTTNLRSPRRLAGLVNEVWDLYATLDKRDRPSGVGYAEIEDESTDQLLYCSAQPGEELDELLHDLAARPGLALIAMDPKASEYVPADVRSAVLSPAEVKGLDFHSVCLLDGGRLLHKLDATVERRVFLEGVDSLRKRLAIDQLRVALSRPTERLFWIDVDPKPAIVAASLRFLNRLETSQVAQSVPSAVKRAIDEEDLDLEERVQRCLRDARQFLDVKPDLAWSRAMLAVTLMGSGRETGHVRDHELRGSVHAAAAEVTFTLAMRGARLSASLGSVDLFEEAARLSVRAHRPALGTMIRAVRAAIHGTSEERPEFIFQLAQAAAAEPTQIESWFLTSIQPRLKSWADQFEAAAGQGNNASLILPVLQPFYEAVGLPDGAERARSLRERTVQSMVKAKRYAEALALIRLEPRRQGSAKAMAAERKLEGLCLEKAGRFEEAAAIYREAGDLAAAVDCLRQVPNVEAAYEIMRQMEPRHIAQDSYDWMMQVREVFAKRPANFNKVMTVPEKKALQLLLEQGLGVQRKVPAARKTGAAAKKAASRKKL